MRSAARTGAAGLALALVVGGAASACGEPDPSPGPEATDLAALTPEPAVGGELLCDDALPRAGVETATSGQRVLDTEGEVLRGRDGFVGGRCQVFVSGQDDPGLRLVVEVEGTGGQDAVRAAGARGARALPAGEGFGYVNGLDPEAEDAEGPLLQGAHGEVLATNPATSGDEVLRVYVSLRVAATGRDHAADVAALLGQVRRTLELEPVSEPPAEPAGPTATG